MLAFVITRIGIRIPTLLPLEWCNIVLSHGAGADWQGAITVCVYARWVSKCTKHFETRFQTWQALGHIEPITLRNTYYVCV